MKIHETLLLETALTQLSHLGCKIEKIKNIFGLDELWQTIIL